MPPLLHGQAEAGRLGWSHRPLRASLRPAQGPLTSTLDPSRRGPLVAARTAELARAHFGLAASTADAVAFATTGAAVAVDGHVVIDLGDAPGAGLGAALVWTLRHAPDAGRLDLLAEDHGCPGGGPDASSTPKGGNDGGAGRDLGALARQAGLFALDIGIWRLDGTTPSPVEATLSPVEATPHPDPLVPPPTTAEQVLLLEQAGLDVVVERGEVRGEVLGLEVARVVVADDAEREDGTASLQVGIGRFDREAFGLLHGELSPPQALARVLDQVRSLRAADAEPHPINRLARERWLRSHLIAHPGLVGLDRLIPIEPLVPRGGLRQSGVAPALGHRPDGTPVIVAASVGVDLDAVPDAADARAWHAPAAALVVAVPVGDAHRATHDLAARLVFPAEVAEIAIHWPR